MMNKAENKAYNSLLDNTAPGAVPSDPIKTDKNAPPTTSVMTTQLLMRVT